MSIKELLTRIIDALKVDYIVEQGTSGIWTYRKWASGIAEMWGRLQTTASYTQVGSVYTASIAGIATATAFPFAYLETPIVNTTQGIVQADYIGAVTGQTVNLSNIATVYLIRANSGSGRVDLNFSVKGRWK